MVRNWHTEMNGSKTAVYAGLALGILAVFYVTLRLGVTYGFIFASLPILLTGLLLWLKYPYWDLVCIFIANYFIMGLTRYFPGLPGGVIMDGLLMLNIVALLIKSCYQEVGLYRARNGLTWAALIWCIYCILEIFNPAAHVTAWATSIRGVAVYSLLLVVLTPILFHRYRDLKRILYIWSVLTLIAAFKAYWQKNQGFDDAELYWLFFEGGYNTHLIHYGIRFFSFFTDAGNFGSGMGFSMVVFSICALYTRNFYLKLYFIGVAIAAAYGMIISGTRGALAVPFAGYLLFLLLSKNIKFISSGILIGILALLFLNYTSIGNGNRYIRRMRTAFNTEEPSLMVRFENQQKLWSIMSDKPFGTGIGLGGGKAKQFRPNAQLSHIATDSWFVMIWVETGIVGLLLHLGVLIYILIRGAVLILRVRHPEVRGYLLALLAGIFGIIVSSYGNEILGQFPTGFIVYMCEAFIFMAPLFDQEIRHRSVVKVSADERAA